MTIVLIHLVINKRTSPTEYVHDLAIKKNEGGRGVLVFKLK
jgi:hypothetical protein